MKFWNTITAGLAASVLAMSGCDWTDQDCQDACEKMKKCEQLHIPVDECRINCENQTLDCSEQIDCILRSDCDAVDGCSRYYPCTIPTWDDDDW